MGNHHSHESKGEDHKSTGSRRGSQKTNISRSNSKDDGNPDDSSEKPQPSPIVPLEKLGKLLVQLSHKEDGVNGITENTIKRHLFPAHPLLARHFFAWLLLGERSGSQVSLAAFRRKAERLLAMLDDALIVETYLRMFGAEEGELRAEQLLLAAGCSFRVFLEQGGAGGGRGPPMEGSQEALGALAEGCFRSAPAHTLGYAVRWLLEHAPRLLQPLHRYTVHTLATRHREVLQPAPQREEPGEPEEPAEVGDAAAKEEEPRLLSAADAWATAAALPASFWPAAPPAQKAGAGAGAGDAAGEARARLALGSPAPRWELLYASTQHGRGFNRFVHHVTAYRGPSAVLLQAEGVLLLAASAEEWRERRALFGGPGAALLQLRPHFEVLARGPLLFLNAALRGLPRGLRLGAEASAPLAAVDEGFERLSFRGRERPLLRVEAWGLGSAASREAQLDVKRWQLREAERQRCVKLSASEWVEHPDRYLLELAGRPQYNSTAS